MSSRSSVTEILPGLWIGDTTAVNDKNFIDTKQIQMVINCSNYPHVPDDPNLQIKYRLQIAPRYTCDQYPSISRILDETCQLIQKHINMYNLLIYCQDGNLRAPLIVIVYLIKYGGMDATHAIECLQSKRVEICTTYLPLIKWYQSNLGR
jgi:protein-tyrosine phosphatase